MSASAWGRTEASFSLMGLSRVALAAPSPQSKKLGLDAESEGLGEESFGVEWTKISHPIPDTETKKHGNK